MQGTIRILVGFLMVFGAVGGLDTGSATLLQGTIAAAIGLAILASGVSAAKRQYPSL